MKITIICAGNHREYERYLEDKMVNPKDPNNGFIYGNSPEVFMGRRGAKVEIIGTFWERNDATKIFNASKTFL